MNRIIPATVVAMACLFSACKKTIDVEPAAPSTKQNPSASQQLALKCMIKEDAARSALARRNQTHSDEPVVLLLDFNGYLVRNTPWNGGNKFYAPGIPESLLPEAARDNILKWVSEDFSVFWVKVTRSEREYQNATPGRRMRCVITRGLNDIFGFYGGIAYLGSLLWGDETPCFVFADNDLYVDRYITEASSHEIGHTFGLYHQATFLGPCEVYQGYNPGLGSGNLSWAPIMGVSYYSQLSTWHEGLSDVNGCSVFQKDVEIIKNIAPIRRDDYSDGFYRAEKLPYKGVTQGLLETANDRDAFEKDYLQPKRFVLTSHGNSDLALEVYNSRGQLLTVHDDLTGTNVDVVISGKRFLKVKTSSLQPYVPTGDGFGGYTLRISDPGSHQ